MRVGEYELMQKIGAGGMGEVWLGRRAATDGFSKTVAVKFPPLHLAADPRARRDFVREVQLSMHLSHSNIVQVFDVGEADGRLFMVMEWVDGCDVRRLLGADETHDSALSVHVAAHVTGEILRALQYAHTLRHEGAELGIVHRDVSPHNVLISTSGEVKLTDFGVARTVHEETSGSHVPGKLRYMAPEQFKGVRRSRAMDLYAVGAILHELLTGARFREAAQEGELYRLIIEGHVPPMTREDVPARLEALRRSLLAHSPERRPKSASEALRFLEDIESPAQARRELSVRCRELTGVEAPRSGVFVRSPSEGERDAEGEPDPSLPQTLTMVGPEVGSSPADVVGDVSHGGEARDPRSRRRFLAAVAVAAICGSTLISFANSWTMFGAGGKSELPLGVAASQRAPTSSSLASRELLSPPTDRGHDGARSSENERDNPSAVALAASSSQELPTSPSVKTTPREELRARASKEHPATAKRTLASVGAASVTFRASDYDFAYLRVNNQVVALEPRATMVLPAGRHAVSMRQRPDAPWRRIGSVQLVGDRKYNVRLRAPGRLELQLLASP